MKKFFSAFLLMTAMVLSVGTFVACNDLTDEMTDVKTQTTQNAATIDALSAKITALETALASAQSAADEAKTAAAAAKQAGDNALAEAQAAKAAAATAEANAIAEAKKQVEALKAVYEAKVAEIETALAGKATQADIEAAVKKAADDAAAALAVIDAKVALKADKTEVEALVAADAAINKEIEALKEFKKLAEELHIELTTDVDSLQLGLADAQAEIEEIWAALYDEGNGLFALIGSNASAISANTELIEALETELDGFYAEVFGEGPNSIMSILGTYANQIAELQAKVDALSVLQSRILSIAYVPEVLLDGRGVIDFTSLYVWDEEAEDYVFVNSAPTTATYLFNPTKANLEGVLFEMATRGIKTRADEAEIATLSIADYNVGQGGKQGRVEFSLTANGELPRYSTQFIVDEFFSWFEDNGVNDFHMTYVWPMDENQVLATLVATAPNGDVIYSDEAFVQQESVSYYEIINKKDYFGDANEDGKADKFVNNFHYKLPEVAQTWNYDIEMVYNEGLNIYDYLETHYWGQSSYGLLTDLNVTPSYKVTLVDEYLGADEITDQQKFVTFDPETGLVAVDSKWLDNSARPAINRTPAFKVESQVLDAEGKLVTVATAYVIIKIVDEVVEPEVKEPVKVSVSGDFLYTDLTDGRDLTKIDEKNGRIVLDWETVNTEIYDELGITHTEFVDFYGIYDVKFYDEEGEPLVSEDEYDPMMGVVYPNGIGFEFDWANWEATSTKHPISMIIYNQVEENTAGSAVVTYKHYNGTEADVQITFNYSVTHEHVWPEFNPDYELTLTEADKAELDGEDYTVIQVKGKLEGGKWVLKSEMKEHFKNYLSDWKEANNHGPLSFHMTFDLQLEDAKITGNNWEDQEIALVNPLVGDHKNVLVTMYNVLANGNKCEKNYVVRFVNPFVATLGNVTLRTFQAEADEEYLLPLLTIKDRDGKVVYKNGKVDGNNVYGASIYKFEATDFKPTFVCEPDASFGGKLKLLENPSWKLEWYNGGTDLQEKKTTTYGVSVAIDGISVVEAEALVEVLSTAESKKQ